MSNQMEPNGEVEPPDCDRNWAELNRDVLLVVFLKLGLMGVFTSAGQVCRSWRKVAKEEPDLWRKIDMTNHGYDHDDVTLAEPTRLAIDRSMGRLEEFSVEYFGDDELLRYLCDRTSVLKKLCLISCYNLSDDEALAETARRQPLLEEIQITLGSFSMEVTKIVGKECPQLKSFKLNTAWRYMPRPDYEVTNDDEALGIAKTMHQLRHLQLIGNRLTNEGLKAILDGCPHLETLDIRRCFNVYMDANMWARYAKLKTIKFPADSLDDYKFKADAYCSEVDGYDDYDDGYDSNFIEVMRSFDGDDDEDDEYMF